MGRLQVNPYASVDLCLEDGVVVAARVRAPIRGERLRESTIRSDDELLFPLLCRLAAREDASDLLGSRTAVARLVRCGILVSREARPRQPVFRCAFRPGKRGAAGPEGRARDARPLRYVVQRKAELPDALRPLALDVRALAPALPRVWVRTPAFGVWVPHWLSGGGARIPRLTFAAARRAGMLAPSEPSSAALATAARRFAERGYEELPQTLPPAAISAMARYFQRRIEEGWARLGDGSDRWVLHNDPVARLFHVQLAGIVSRLAKEPVKPSYAYFASYRPGAFLRRHCDREQCEYSISLLLRYRANKRDAAPWPLWLEVDGRDVPIVQAPGDGLLYRGRELPHFRRPLPEGASSMSLFLHYVPKRYRGSLD